MAAIRMGALLASLVTIMLAACVAAGASRTIELVTLNDSGVGGTITLTEMAPDRTRVDVQVEPAGNDDMPAHVHPGSCADLVPQPKYPLHNVVEGRSTTVVPAPLGELLAGDLAINLHRSNEDLFTYTACADLG